MTPPKSLVQLRAVPVSLEIIQLKRSRLYRLHSTLSVISRGIVDTRRVLQEVRNHRTLDGMLMVLLMVLLMMLLMMLTLMTSARRRRTLDLSMQSYIMRQFPNTDYDYRYWLPIPIILWLWWPIMCLNVHIAYNSSKITSSLFSADRNFGDFTK